MELWSRRRFFSDFACGERRCWSQTSSSGQTGSQVAEGKQPPVPLYRLRACPAREMSAQGKRPADYFPAPTGSTRWAAGMDILKKGGRHTGRRRGRLVTIVEDDPNDDSVGYGGLPNEEGEVETRCQRDARGRRTRAGSVARRAAESKNVSRLAKTVMEKSNHVMIVGDGSAAICK